MEKRAKSKRKKVDPKNCMNELKSKINEKIIKINEEMVHIILIYIY
jgi:hypothetical protein